MHIYIYVSESLSTETATRNDLLFYFYCINLDT